MSALEDGRLPDGTGLSQAEPKVSALRASIPDARMLPNTTYYSCILCHGTRLMGDEKCSYCIDPEMGLARRVLERLHPNQMAFLRAFGHTLAYQPVTPAEYPQIEFFVEEDDGEFDEEAGPYDDSVWLIPPTRHWFASGLMRSGPCGTAHFIRYNPLGLLLRECLMCGADALVPQFYAAQGIDTRSAATTGAVGEADESPVAKPCAPTDGS